MNNGCDSPVKPPSLPTKRDAAARLNVGVRTIDNHLKRGTLQKIKLSPRCVRIDPASLERLASVGTK